MTASHAVLARPFGLLQHFLRRLAVVSSLACFCPQSASRVPPPSVQPCPVPALPFPPPQDWSGVSLVKVVLGSS